MDQSVGFTWRMQTHEATIHRVDAELTAGLPVSPVDAEVAAEGIDHVPDVMWNWVPGDAERRVVATIELHATDTGQSWLVDVIFWTGSAWGQQFTDQVAGVRSSRQPGQADAVVSGTVMALDLLVWNREQDVVAEGDEAALREWDALLAQGIS